MAGKMNISNRYKIIQTIYYGDRKIILLEPVSIAEPLNNIYCVDENNNILWQVEGVIEKFKNKTNMPYEGMSSQGHIITAANYIGVSYDIDIDTGKIVKSCIVK